MPKPKDWLLFATYDLRTAKLLIDIDESFISTALFHAQEGAIKALTGYLLSKNVSIKKPSNILKLAKRCSMFNPDFSSILQDISAISPYSIKIRYPNDYYIAPDIDTARILIAKAANIYKFVEDKIFAN